MDKRTSQGEFYYSHFTNAKWNTHQNALTMFSFSRAMLILQISSFQQTRIWYFS